MKRKLLVLAALLSLCVLLAACKKSDDTISTPASTATSSAEPEATPEPTLPPYEANVLTGEPKGADYPEGQRITAVMVNNIVAARPQRGLSKADILFEIKVEGGITRFLLLFRGSRSRSEVVATFLAVLELCKARVLHLAGSETDCIVRHCAEAARIGL